MLAILNSLNAHNSPIFQPILMILVLKFMVHRVLFNKLYLSLGLLSPLNIHIMILFFIQYWLSFFLCQLNYPAMSTSTKMHQKDQMPTLLYISSNLGSTR